MTKQKNTEDVKSKEKILKNKTSEEKNPKGYSFEFEEKSKDDELLDLSEPVQRKFLAVLLDNRDFKPFVSLFMKIIEPKTFDNPVNQNIFRIIKKVYDQYELIVDVDGLRQEFQHFLNEPKNEKLPLDEYKDVIEDILILKNQLTPKDSKYITGNIIKFAQYQAAKNALMNGAKKKMPKLDIEGIEEDLRKAREIGIELIEDDAGFKLTPLSEVESEEIEWLWYGIIPKGKLSILCGDPNVGKSFLTTFLACNLSIGKSLPHTLGRPTTKGSILMLTAEDSPSDTIKPRIENMKGDASKIIIIEGVKEKDSVRSFDFTEDIKKLEIVLERREDIKLLIIDPITAYMKTIDMKMDSEVRSNIIKPLSKLAEQYKISIILVAHLNKNPALRAVYRISGTVGFLAGARTVWLVMDDDEDRTGEKRKLCCLKMNIAKKPKQAMVFRIFEPKEGKPILTFLDEVVYVDIESELSGKEKPIHIAKDFLKRILADGMEPSKEVTQIAEANGIKSRTLKRAREILKINSIRESDIWYMELPKGKVSVE